MGDKMSIISDKGRVNMNGLDINIADVIGDKIVNQWMATLGDEDMQLFFKELNDFAFTTSKGYIDGKYTDIKTMNKVKNDDNSYYHRKEDTPLWKDMQRIFLDKFNEKIEEECNRILDTDEYKEKATKIAEEVIDYAINGYKKDMIDRIKERLVGNLINPSPSYGNMDLRDIIRSEIQSYIH